jgi:hypothetical protein
VSYARLAVPSWCVREAMPSNSFAVPSNSFGAARTVLEQSKCKLGQQNGTFEQFEQFFADSLHVCAQEKKTCRRALSPASGHRASGIGAFFFFLSLFPRSQKKTVRTVRDRYFTGRNTFSTVRELFETVRKRPKLFEAASSSPRKLTPATHIV